VGSDVVVAGRGNDTVDGAAGNDRIFAGAGVDTVRGGDGNDRIWAMARVDAVAGDGTADTVDGGAGNDRIMVRDGEPDSVSCGEGSDRAILDTQDVIADATADNPNGSCELVVRAEPRVRDAETIRERVMERIADLAARWKARFGG
jgi:Ca2+-binding RTX toxin-like protein